MADKNRLFEVIDNFKNSRVLVVGDIILDEYIWGKANRLSPEAPVPVLEVGKYDYLPGGAANVAHNIKTLGGEVAVAGVIGHDFQAEQLTTILEDSNIDSTCLIKDENRPTTLKSRLLAHNRQQLVRFDRELRDPISVEIEEKLAGEMGEYIRTSDLVLVSDYAKGVLTDSFLSKVINMCKEARKPLLVDPKGLDFRKYSGATLITPNKGEAEKATQSPEGTQPEILAQKLREQLDIQYVLVTLGEDGVLFSDGTNVKTIPSIASEVYDVTGAGDSLISAVSLAMTASGCDPEVSVEIGNYAAGVAVRKIGTTAVTPSELKNIIELHLTDKTINV